YRLCCESREVSLLGRKEVLTGKAKFGIFGDGKEVAQVALAKFFQPGDFLSGYYRDQTLAFATGQATIEQFFSQLYADSDTENGNEICFATIGDASTSEGHFWEIINAAGVLEIPLAVFVWDDGYGISVPRELQTTKGSISEALRGMQKKDGTNGINIYKVKAWDYSGMCEIFEMAIRNMRETHVPALFHVEEVTQPQGHSTSGSHERYKTSERLEWERSWDANKKFREWILA